MVSARLLVTSLLSATLASAQYFNSSSSELSSSSASSGNSSSSEPPSSSSEAPTSSLPSSSSSPSATETPYLEGSFVDGLLQWKLFVPGSLGPWTSLEFDADGEGYTIQEVDVEVDDEPKQADVATQGGSITVVTGEQAPPGGWLTITYIAERLSNAREFTSDAVLTITTPEGRKLIRRAVLTYEFSSTITIPDGASSVTPSSSATSGQSTSSTDGGNGGETTIWGTTVTTLTTNNIVTIVTTYCPITTKSKTHGEKPTGEPTYTHPTATGTGAPGKPSKTPITTITKGEKPGTHSVPGGGEAHHTTNENGESIIIVYKTSTNPAEGAHPTGAGGEGSAPGSGAGGAGSAPGAGGEGAGSAPGAQPTGGQGGAATTPAEQSGAVTTAGVSTYEGAGHKLASGLGLLLPVAVFFL